MIEADLLIAGATLVTMDAERPVIADGAVAVAGDRIAAVGKREALVREVRARETLDARGFVATPGFVDAHIHITGDPLTRGFPRGGPDLAWGEKLQKWVIPIFRAQTPAEEALSAKAAALAMLRAGTTTFVEAGTVIHLDAVMEALAQSGIRGRVGQWVEGRAYDPAQDQAALTAQAIGVLEREVELYPDRGGEALLAAWPVLVGHSTNPDAVWLAAKALADDRGLKVTAHMSPRQGDPDWFLARHGRRPLEHLADIGVLGPSVLLTHLAAIDAGEFEALARTGAGAICCPHAALQGGFGLARSGLMPEMLAARIPFALGTDGVAADILGAGRLLASLFRDARGDQELIPADQVLETATLGAARALGLDRLIGSLESGKKADVVLHDARLPEWGGPLFDPVEQLAFSAPVRGVHSVWVDGVRRLDAGRATWIDEDALMEEVRGAGEAVVARTGLVNPTAWPAR